MKKTDKKATKVYIFHRDKMWYPIELYDDKDAKKNAEHNAGTTKVTDATGRIVWLPWMSQKH